MKIIFLFTVLMCTTSAYTQEAKPAVVATCGGSSQAIAGYTISFTVGEVVIMTAENNIVFTQGFHQPFSATDYPLVALNLKGATKNNYVQLDWTTSAEVNNDWFYIERSQNATQFIIIDSVRSKAVNGNSTSPLNYTYNDLQPLNGNNYYRLRQVSKIGVIRYSETVLVNFSGTAWRAAIYPNPVHGTLFMQLFSDRQTKAAITLHNLTGQLVLKRELDLPIGYSKQTLPLWHMKAGMYILTIRDTRANRTIQVKLVKH